MKLSEIFNQLSVGELSMLSIGKQEQGVISEANWAKVLPHVNLGLMALFTRFNLRMGQVTLSLQSGVRSYSLTAEHALTNTRTSSSATKYLLDSADEPFKDDLLKVTKVIAGGGFEMTLNDATDEYACHMASSTRLMVPRSMVTEGVKDIPEFLKVGTLDIVYRAAHPKIVIPIGFFDPARIEVALPDTHLQALLYNIASRAHNPMGMQNEFNMGNNWFQKYELECQRLENEGMEIEEGESSTRFQRNGWC